VKNNTINYITESIKHANTNLEITLKDMDNISTVIAMDEFNVVNVLNSKEESPSYEWFMQYKKIHTLLTSLTTYKQSNFSGIAIFSMDGQLYTAGNPLVKSDDINEAWAKKILGAKGEKVIIKRGISYGSMDSSQMTNTITLGRTIMQKGNPLAMVIINMRYDIVKNIFDVNYLKEGHICVLDKDGNYIYKSDSISEDGNILIDLDKNNYKNLIKSNKAITMKLGDKKYIAAHYRSEYTGWDTLAIIPQDALLKQFKGIKIQMVSIVILVLVLVFAATLLVSKQITRNLKVLLDTMKSVKHGNLFATPKGISQDEVGQLSMEFTKMMSQINSLMDDIKKQEKIKREDDLKILQTQINPHFIYNTLNTIRYLAELQNVKNIKEVTVSFIELLRVSIGNAERFITIQKEIDYVQSYVNILKYKYLDKFNVVYQIEDTILQCKTLKMTLQPIVENALVHGIDFIDREGFISIKVYSENGVVKLIVTDNGVGMTGEQITKVLKGSNSNENKSRFNGIGISNVNERIKMFFGDKYGLNIYSQLGECTTVEITIPIIEGENQIEAGCTNC
jgi:two-component system, sensor histidine kinase YesM